MSYDESSAAAEQARIDNEYARLYNEYQRQAAIQQRLRVEEGQCQRDVSASIDFIRKLHKAVVPPLETTAVDTDKEQVVAANASRAIDDLVDSYRLLNNASTASKNLTSSIDKYYTLYGLYNELRNVSLGYVVGLDKDMWQSDVPRKTVEKMYLANTDYWLAYATMAVMLWASDEQDACARAVSKAMQMNERKSSLFFLLACLRFNRMEAAKEWYKVYFDLVDLNGMGEEIVYILQVLLCGALGSDLEFGRSVQTKMRELLKEASSNINTRRETQESVDGYFKAFASVTSKEFLSLKHICAEYGDMMALLSEAEKNAKLRDYFYSVLTSDSELSDRLSERIEDSLYALISANDDSEQELLDKITYEEKVVELSGNLEEAKKAYDELMAQKRKNHNIALIMVNTAFDVKSKVDSRVKRFALDFIRKYCITGAEKFVAYRKREKQVYDFDVDGCKLSGDENSFEENKPKLLSYYDGIVKKRMANDKVVISLNKLSIMFCVLFVFFAGFTALSFGLGWQVAASVVSIILTILFIAAFVLCLYFKHDQKLKIRKNFEYRINNGLKMLEEGLKDLAAWRAAYKTADSDYAGLIKVLKEDNNG